MIKKLQDVTPPKRSIHDIPVPNGKSRKKTSRSNKTNIKKSSSFFKKMIMAILLIVIVIALFISFTASSVIVNIVPRQLEQRTDSSFIAVSDNETGGVPFDIIMLDKTEVKEVEAIGEEQVMEKARGEIIIFNDYGSKSQRLIKNTRFETPEGLIYRIQNSVVVPGQKKDSSGKTIPGSLEVTVYADQPGEKYNIGLKDFTIPGFEGTERFNSFYARSKTAMKGGFEGIKKIASDEDIKSIQTQLSIELIAKLIEEVKTQVPEGFVLYEDAIFSEAEFIGIKDIENGIGVEEKATVYAIIFKYLLYEQDYKHLSENYNRFYCSIALGNKDNINRDYRVRLLKIPQFAWENYDKIPAKFQSVLEAFCQGINFYMQKNPDKVPPGMTEVKPQERGFMDWVNEVFGG